MIVGAEDATVDLTELDNVDFGTVVGFVNSSKKDETSAAGFVCCAGVGVIEEELVDFFGGEKESRSFRNCSTSSFLDFCGGGLAI